MPVRPDIKLTVYLLSETFLFPLFLMSALERKSAVTPFSQPVWKSLWYAWHAWVLFYLLTLLMGETFVYALHVIPFGGIHLKLAFAALVAPLLIDGLFSSIGPSGMVLLGPLRRRLRKLIADRRGVYSVG